MGMHLLQLHLLGQVHTWSKLRRETKVQLLFQGTGYPIHLGEGDIEARVFLLLMKIRHLKQCKKTEELKLKVTLSEQKVQLIPYD